MRLWERGAVRYLLGTPNRFHTASHQRKGRCRRRVWRVQRDTSRHKGRPAASSACSHKTRRPCRINDGEKHMPPARQDSRTPTPTPTNMKAARHPLLCPTGPDAPGFFGSFCAAASRIVRAPAAPHRCDCRTYCSSPQWWFLYEILQGVNTRIISTLSRYFTTSITYKRPQRR